MNLVRLIIALCKFRIVRNQNWAHQPTNTSPWQICSCSIIWVGGVTENLRQLLRLTHCRFNSKHTCRLHRHCTITTFAVRVKTTVIKISFFRLPRLSLWVLRVVCKLRNTCRDIVLSTQTRLCPHSHTIYCVYQCHGVQRGLAVLLVWERSFLHHSFN